jgi:outer membrane immunogenic protein
VTLGAAWSEATYIEMNANEQHNFGFDEEVFAFHLGYDHQVGNVVLGLEVDWTDLDLADQRISGVVTREINFDHLTTLRGRFGLATPCVLAYATLGAAYMQTDLLFQVNPPGGGPAVTERHNLSDVFFTVGAGLEAFVWQNVTARIEYLFVNTELDDARFLPGFDDGPLVNDGIHIVRVGLMWRL